MLHINSLKYFFLLYSIVLSYNYYFVIFKLKIELFKKKKKFSKFYIKFLTIQF